MLKKKGKFFPCDPPEVNTEGNVVDEKALQSACGSVSSGPSSISLSACFPPFDIIILSRRLGG